jgi:hypothetical protein
LSRRFKNTPLIHLTNYANGVQLMYQFIELPVFSRYREDYLDDAQFHALQVFLSENPKAGDVVPDTGGVRKLRWSRTGMGKRGGVRVIYFAQDGKGRIWLLTLYAKSAQENIQAKVLRALREVAEHAEID